MQLFGLFVFFAAIIGLVYWGTRPMKAPPDPLYPPPDLRDPPEPQPVRHYAVHKSTPLRATNVARAVAGTTSGGKILRRPFPNKGRFYGPSSQGSKGSEPAAKQTTGDSDDLTLLAVSAAYLASRSESAVEAPSRSSSESISGGGGSFDGGGASSSFGESSNDSGTSAFDGASASVSGGVGE